MRQFLSAGALLVVVGCGPSPDNWPEKSAKASCDFSRRCAETNFWATYDSTGSCVTQSEAALRAEALEKASCGFDQSAAQDCLKALGSSCKKAGTEAETHFDACYRVYACDGQVLDTGN